MMINFLTHDEASRKKIEECKEKHRFVSLEFDAIMFSQVWGSTCTAFDVTTKGEPTIGGSAMTRAYTLVLRELITDSYRIFIDGRPCYIITDANETFYKDLKAQNMKSLSEAIKEY